MNRYQFEDSISDYIENKLSTEAEDFILKVAGEVDGEGMAQIAGVLGIDTSEIDLDDEMLLDDLYVDIEMAVKNASAKEIIRLANELKGLKESDATSWKYNNSPAGDTLDLAPRKVGQSIKESDRKVDSKMWSRMDDEQQMDALLTVFKDPDDAEMYVGEKWDDLPEEKNFMTTTIKPLANEYFSSPSGAQKTPRNPVTKDVTSGANKAATIRSMIGEKVFKGLKEQYSTMGGYVELMDLDDHLDSIHYEFERWREGPSTEITDIEPAKEEVISYVVDYLRNTL